jgi:hypothetical protein
VQRWNLTLTLDPKSKYNGEGVLPGAYRRHTTASVTLVRAAGTNRASPVLAGPPPLYDARDRATVTEPLNGGALTLGWTRAPARGLAAAPATTTVHHGQTLCISVVDVQGKKGRGCRERKEEGGRRRPWAKQHSTSPLPADRQPWRFARCCRCALRKGADGEKDGSRVTGRRNGFCSREEFGRQSDRDPRWWTVVGDRRKLGQMWPKQSRNAGRFGGLAVSCWAADPSRC